MTVGMLIERLEWFRHEIRMYSKLCKGGIPHSLADSDEMASSALEAFRDKLRQQWDQLQEYVRVFSHGRYRIHLDSRGLQDIYARAFSENCLEGQLEFVMEDLELIVAELQRLPPLQFISLFKQSNDNPGSQTLPSFGLLGHQGYSCALQKPATLRRTFEMIRRILDQRIERPEEQERLQGHLKAIVEHSDLSGLLAMPPSRIF
jgi:hypothetical protein